MHSTNSTSLSACDARATFAMDARRKDTCGRSGAMSATSLCIPSVPWRMTRAKMMKMKAHKRDGYVMGMSVLKLLELVQLNLQSRLDRKKMDCLSFLLWILISWVAMHLILSLVPSNKKLPPGPFPWPIIGNLLLLGDSPHKPLTELAKVHGPIMCLQLGTLRTVIISSASMAKEVLHKNDASVCNKIVPDSLTALQHHEFSFLFLPIGGRWKSFRRICNNHVFSRSRLDASQFLRRKKLEDLISYVKLCSQAGEAVDIGQVAFNTGLNLMSNTFFSVDLADANSSTSRDFKEVFSLLTLEAAKPNLADYFPVLKHIDPQGIRRRMGVHLRKMLDLFGDMISRRLAEKEGCLDVNDALDCLLHISHEKSEELQLPHIPHLLLELFVGGTDTTSKAVEWAMTELLHNPDKMNKARQELERFVGRGIPVKEENFPSLPYMQAIIKETLRMHPPGPFIIRRADSDLELCGFTVPKDSQIIINLWAMGKDPSTWNNPDTFEPERFLGTEIDVKGQDFELIPFGAGRRICPGLPLAMRMVPLMLGPLINCFDWKLEDGVEPESMDMVANFGLTLQKAQPLRAVPISII